jgi:hypothetical protein
VTQRSTLPDASEAERAFRSAMDAAAEEHASRAVSGLLADLDLYLHREAADHPENPTRQWAICLLVRALGQRIRP